MVHPIPGRPEHVNITIETAFQVATSTRHHPRTLIILSPSTEIPIIGPPTAIRLIPVTGHMLRTTERPLVENHTIWDALASLLLRAPLIGPG